MAGEIFEAVKDAVSEYQEEIKRTKQENLRLRQKLIELNISISCEEQTEGSVYFIYTRVFKRLILSHFCTVCV